MICLEANSNNKNLKGCLWEQRTYKRTKMKMKKDSLLLRLFIRSNVQYNLNGSNTDGSFIVDDSNSFFSPYKILPKAQENKYLGIFSYFIMELYVVCTH